MGKNDKAETTAKPKQKRTILSPAERIAKMEADLEAARKKEEAKARKAMVSLEEQTKKLVAKRDEINAKIEALGKQHVELSTLAGYEVSTTEDEAPATS